MDLANSKVYAKVQAHTRSAHLVTSETIDYGNVR